MLKRLPFLALCVNIQLLSKVDSGSQHTPRREDFDTCKLTTEEKERFLDDHNKFRGMVNPPAANMEFVSWDDDLANLAQMWTNKCIWSHGFRKFGSEYPNPVNHTGHIGQNLARDYVEIPHPEEIVERWYDENQYYTYWYGHCSKEPCGHYTQMSWAKVKYIGCAVNLCPNFGNGFNNGGSFVGCDYDKVQITGEYPYQEGTPCSKCASGKGFCYKNLCRDCADFDKNCGTALTFAMCTSHVELMEKKCPKMCKLCKCPLQCKNGGTVNKETCTCSCPTFWTGMDCSELCEDKKGKQFCKQQIQWQADCKKTYMKEGCAASCGYCDDGSGTFTTTLAPVTAPTTSSTSEPASVSTHPTKAAPQEPTKKPVSTTPSPQECINDTNPNCEMWATIGECEKNPLWMLPNCCVSCKYHRTPKVCNDSSPRCPRWAYFGECEINKVWMLGNCRKSCNQCGDCKDTDLKCPSWAILKQCSMGDRVNWMNTNCRESCGLCRVYDRHQECPALAVLGECKKSIWTWMMSHCPRSCDVPVSEALFCGGKPNGHYQSPSSCQAYIACSHGVTTHVTCPPGKTFDTIKRICELSDRVTCSVVHKKSEPTKKYWKILWSLKRG